jgi:hypothetical protein
MDDGGWQARGVHSAMGGTPPAGINRQEGENGGKWVLQTIA